MPAQHGVLGRDEILHDGNGQPGTVRVEDQSEWVLTDEAQAQNIAVKAFGEIGSASGEEPV